MKRTSTLSIALTLSAVLIFLTSFISTVQAQQRRLSVSDSGVVTLGQNQKLRVIVATASDNQTLSIKFRRCTFTQQNGIFTVNSSQIGPIVMLVSNEARFFDIFSETSAPAVRARIGANRPDIVVTFQIIDTTSGEIQSFINGGVEHEDTWDNN